MLSTRFTGLVGCTTPVQMAGMGAAATPALVAAVCEAGAFGMLGTARPGLDAGTLSGLLDEVQALTDRPFGVNFIVAPEQVPEPACFAIAARRARLVEFFYGDPDAALVETVHAENALACWQVGTCEEAIAAEAAGCDLIVAQGVEAGGHVRGRIGRDALLDAVLKAVGIPVLASGGIGTGRQIAAALGAGADGVRIGTRFLAAEEAGIHPEYRAALIEAGLDDTVYCDVFNVGWTDAPHRVLRSCLSALEQCEGDTVGSRDSLDGRRIPAIFREPLVPDATTTGTVAAMPLWAGESVGSVTTRQPARDIVDALTLEAEAVMRSSAKG